MSSRMDGALFTDGELCNRTDSLRTLGRSLPACASLLSISVVTQTGSTRESGGVSHSSAQF
jgi:hypothetical protein